MHACMHAYIYIAAQGRFRVTVLVGTKRPGGLDAILNRCVCARLEESLVLSTTICVTEVTPVTLTVAADSTPS